MRMLRVNTFTLVILTVLCPVISAVPPGAQVRLTNSGLDYGVNLAVKDLQNLVAHAKIPPLHGSGHHLTYDLTNLKITEFAIGSKSLRPISNQGISWKMGGVSITMQGNYAYKYHIFIVIRDHGSFRVSASGLSLDLLVKVMANTKTGNPVFRATGCNCHINHLNVKFTGGKASWLYNLLANLARSKIRNIIQKAVCKEAENSVNVNGNKALQRLNLKVLIAHKFMLSYALTDNPHFTSQYLETFHKGEVYWATDPLEAPFKPLGFPPISDVSKMAYVWLSDYVANTFSYSAFTHGYLRYNLTTEKLPPESRHYLNTTCKTTFTCIGNIIPQIGAAHPNSTVKIELVALAPPTATIMPQGIAAIGQGIAKFYAVSHTGVETFMLHLKLNLTMSVMVSLKDAVIYGQVDKLDLKFHVVKSSIGAVQDIILDAMAKFAVSLYVKPELNKFGAKGFNLPLTGPIHLKSPKLTLIKHGIVISSDVVYHEEETKGTESPWMAERSFEAVGNQDQYHVIRL